MNPLVILWRFFFFGFFFPFYFFSVDSMSFLSVGGTIQLEPFIKFKIVTCFDVLKNNVEPR